MIALIGPFDKKALISVTVIDRSHRILMKPPSPLKAYFFSLLLNENIPRPPPTCTAIHPATLFYINFVLILLLAERRAAVRDFPFANSGGQVFYAILFSGDCSGVSIIVVVVIQYYKGAAAAHYLGTI